MSRATGTTGAVRFLRLALWASAAFGLLFVVLGLLVMAVDASSHDDMWDGLGVFVGRLIAAAGLLWSAPHAVLAMVLTRATRRGRSPKRAAAAGSALGALLVTLGIYVAASGAARLGTMLAEITVSLLVLVAGIAVLTDDSAA